MRRGEIHLADLGESIGHEQAGTRPVLIVSAQPWLDSRPPVVTVVPITRTRWESATRVEVEPGTSGLAATSYARCEDVRAISPARLVHRFGSADDIVVARVDAVLRRLLAL